MAGIPFLPVPRVGSCRGPCRRPNGRQSGAGVGRPYDAVAPAPGAPGRVPGAPEPQRRRLRIAGSGRGLNRLHREGRLSDVLSWRVPTGHFMHTACGSSQIPFGVGCQARLSLGSRFREERAIQGVKSNSRRKNRFKKWRPGIDDRDKEISRTTCEGLCPIPTRNRPW